MGLNSKVLENEKKKHFGALCNEDHAPFVGGADFWFINFVRSVYEYKKYPVKSPDLIFEAKLTASCSTGRLFLVTTVFERKLCGNISY